MADAQIKAGGVSPAPLAYEVPGSQEIIVKSLYAEYDGSASASSYVPAIQLIAPGGGVAGTYIANGQVAAGASADASWFPFVGAAGVGVQFDTYPQVGDWLNVVTTGYNPIDGWGIDLECLNGQGAMQLHVEGNDIDIKADTGGGVVITGDHASVTALGGALELSAQAGNELQIATNGGGDITVDATTGDLHLKGVSIDSIATDTALVVTDSVRMTHTNGNQVYVDGGIVVIDGLAAPTFGVRISIATGSKLEVDDHLGNPVFRVNEDGSLQGKTGKALTFNL